MKLPSAYAFLNTIGTLPRTIQSALPLLGIAEVQGKGSNQKIMGWAQELNAAGHPILGFSDDDIPWCGLFAAYVVFKAGKQPVTNPLWARNWSKFGTTTTRPSLGDVLVFSRGTGGHVGFYVAEDATHYHVLGGNQKNAVTIGRIEKERCIAVRRPPMSIPPASVRPFRVAAVGEVTTNEA